MKVKKDIRETKAFQKRRAKELGMTLEQYLGIEPIVTFYFGNKNKKNTKTNK